MRNRYLDAGTAQEIDGLVDRVHGDLGSPERAIDLSAVRHLLRLDLEYYKADDPTLLQQVVHKMRIGAKQVLERPSLLFDAITAFNLRALIFPDRKRILLDAKLPDLKKRWSESHEIAHGLIPWHSEYLLGDTKDTLSPGCHHQLESEANYGAGRLLFPHKTMTVMVNASPPSIASIRAIATHFDNTITSSFWRFVEYSDRPCLGVIGAHPHHGSEDEAPVEHFIRSRRFETEFSKTSEELIFELIRGYCAFKKTGPLGTSEISFPDDRGDVHRFRAETFSNGYKVLTLIAHIERVTTSILVP